MKDDLPNSLLTGTRLGPYEVQSRIGAGGMGEVYQARDTRLERLVAIKVLAPEIAAEPVMRSRFEREARAVAALNHPNICALYDVGPNYLVMELVQGQPLAGPMPLARALLLAREILAALTAAHRKSITHRDLKPANILVTAQGIKLLDFGLARLGLPDGAGMAPVEATLLTAPQSLTGEHTILGTLHYMSPEQAQGKPADARSDIFSFGVVLYEMLTGRRAFDGVTPASVLAAIIERDAPSVGAVAPRALDQVLQKCLAKDPNERWQTARDVHHALDLVDESPSSWHTLPRRKRTLAPLSVTGFLAAVALGALLWANWPPSVLPARRLSFHLSPPAGAEFQSSATSGGSAISPDGGSVAFVAATNGTPRLWIRTLDSPAARELEETEGAKLPFWSPDSRSLAFFTNGDLRRIEVAGGTAIVLARAPDPRGGAWSTDGTIVFSPTAAGPLQRISRSGGLPTPLTRLADGESSHRWPQFLPDGQTILYFSQGRTSSVQVTTLARPLESRRLLTARSQALYFTRPPRGQGYLVWIAGKTVVTQPFDAASAELIGSPITVPGIDDVAAFSGTNRGTLTVSNEGTLLYATGGMRYRLEWFRRDGTSLGPVGATDQYVGLRLSPNGRETLVTISDAALRGDLWRVDLASGARSRVTSDGQGWYAVWSPDSQQIALSSQGGFNPRVTSARETGQVRSLLASGNSMYPSDWSRDGLYLAYAQGNPETSNDIWLLALAGNRKPLPFLQSRFTEFHAQFSPDGAWLAFTSNEAGRDDVYVQSLHDAGTRQLVSGGGGSYPRWSSEGRELFYRAADGQLMTVAVRTAGSSLELGTPTALFRLVTPPGVHPYPYDVAKDGRILALVPAAGNRQDVNLTVLINWQTALDR